MNDEKNCCFLLGTFSKTSFVENHLDYFWKEILANFLRILFITHPNDGFIFFPILVLLSRTSKNHLPAKQQSFFSHNLTRALFVEGFLFRTLWASVASQLAGIFFSSLEKQFISKCRGIINVSFLPCFLLTFFFLHNLQLLP